MKLELNIRSRIASLAREDGFGIVEALVAAIILVLAVLATFTAYDASTRSTFRAQQSQVRLGQAQQELEKIRALPYDQIAMTYVPGPSADPSDPSDPLSRVQYQNGAWTFNLDRNGSNDASLVYSGSPLLGGGQVSGGIDPVEHFQSGDVGGYIYRFVVWQRNHGCDTQACTSQDFKRVIILVKPDGTAAGGSRDYVEIHSDFIDPADTSISDLPPNGGDRVTGQPFWLTDTPCDSGGDTVRQDITIDHPLHNTLGNCGTAGAPDALIPALPPGNPSSTPLYDYQSDWTPSPDTDEGIQIQRPSSNNCGSASGPSQIHRWVTDPMDAGFVMTGNATLILFSKTINGLVNQAGTICASLFVRSSSGNTVLPGSVSYSKNPWPTSFDSGSLSITLNTGAYTILKGEQLGLAISLDRGGTTVSRLELMYDHPRYPAQLEVDTTTACNDPNLQPPPC
jgi:hypothetical protein